MQGLVGRRDRRTRSITKDGCGRLGSLLSSLKRCAAGLLAVGAFTGIAIASIWMAAHTSTESARIANERFKFNVSEAQFAIRQRLIAYRQVLRGGVGLFAATGNRVSREQWRTYVGTLAIDKEYPGIQGVGFTKQIAAQERRAHILAVRSGGIPDYQISPGGDRDEYTSIIYLEPFDWRNRRAFGFDMFTEPVRREAMIMARDTGAPSISGKVTLVQETDQGVQCGFLMYLPVYQTAVPPTTVEERRAELVGYVYAPFRMRDLMRGILRFEQLSGVRLEIYDGVSLRKNDELYDSTDGSGPRTSAFTVVEPLEIDGRTWTIRFSSLPTFDATIDGQKPRLILSAGLLLGLLFAVAVWSLLINRARARELADANEQLSQARDAADDTREFLEMVIENTPSPIVVKDAQSFKYILLNRAAERLLGVPRTRYIGKTAFEVYPKEEAEAIFGYDRAIVKSRRQLCFDEHWLDTPGNGRRHVKPSSFPVLNGAGEPKYLLTVIEDVTERKEAQARIQHMAFHDLLTDLPNQPAFNEHLASAFEAAKSSGRGLAVLCLDLDRFKEINDIFGHRMGDAILCRAAERFSVAAAGAFLARLGSDDFAIILTDCVLPSGATALADRLLAVSGDEFEIDGHRAYIGLNIGVAIYPADGADPGTLVANADAALCRAKADGRGMVRFFDADLDIRLREKRALHQDLNVAVSERQLVLHYQPQAKVGGEIIGFEVLLRWQHPNRGLISPAVFIPLAEESGAILTIGTWVLREACREAAAWAQPLRIAVNLSPAQFVQGDLPALVHTTLLETGLAADRLELEITEGVLIGDFDRAIAILRRLKALGVHIAMDDFGTGYSSLSYLQSFPFDKIKIDQSFISDVERNGQSAAIVRAVIGLGRGLNLPVVAEGVETKEQLDFLSREACDQVQGYLIGRPRPITDYAKTISGAGHSTHGGRCGSCVTEPMAGTAKAHS
ncbi:diguanylate cyclase (GGDEF)-like protein/PAS domain S-box-containing protein [Bradyrhizobium sp. USDA 4518]